MRRWILVVPYCVVFAMWVGNAGLACTEQPLFDRSHAEEYAEIAALPFRFPLDNMNELAAIRFATFCTAGGTEFGPSGKYHAAEDYHRPAGTPVYAVADGVVSFSGPKDGYGWLIIIDHPQANLYSLYGHLGPSRWRIRSGSVEKGEIIGYLGNSEENGGSAEHPMRPHLHFGVRAGQRADYGNIGEWRWMAGWVKPCPADIGWLRPSAIIAAQVIPDGGFPGPPGGFFTRLGVEVLLMGIYILGGLCLLLYGLARKKVLLLIIGGGGLFAVAWILRVRGMQFTEYVMGVGVVLFLVGVSTLVNRPVRGTTA